MDAETIRCGRRVWNKARSTRGITYDPEKGMRWGAAGAAIGAIAGIASGPIGWTGLLASAATGGAFGAMAGFLPDFKMPAFSEDNLKKTIPTLTKQWITRDGGTIDAAGCTVEFPYGSVQERKEMQQFSMFRTGMCTNYTEITRLLDVDGAFSGYVDVTLESIFAPCDGEEVPVYVFSIPDSDNKWVLRKKLLLTDTLTLNFDIRTLDYLVAVVHNDDLGKVRYRIKTLLYANNQHSFRFYFFNQHTAIENNLENKAEKEEYKRYLEFDFAYAQDDDELAGCLEVRDDSRFQFEKQKSQITITDAFENALTYRTRDVSLKAKSPSDIRGSTSVTVTSHIENNGKMADDERTFNHKWQEGDTHVHNHYSVFGGHDNNYDRWVWDRNQVVLSQAMRNLFGLNQD